MKVPVDYVSVINMMIYGSQLIAQYLKSARVLSNIASTSFQKSQIVL
jgi:hypothetical protein